MTIWMWIAVFFLPRKKVSLQSFHHFPTNSLQNVIQTEFIYLSTHTHTHIFFLSLIRSQWNSSLGIYTLFLSSSISYPIFVLFIGTAILWIHYSKPYCQTFDIIAWDFSPFVYDLFIALASFFFLQLIPIIFFKIQLTFFFIQEFFWTKLTFFELLLYIVFLDFSAEWIHSCFWHFYCEWKLLKRWHFLKLISYSLRCQQSPLYKMKILIIAYWIKIWLIKCYYRFPLTINIFLYKFCFLFLP